MCFDLTLWYSGVRLSLSGVILTLLGAMLSVRCHVESVRCHVECSWQHQMSRVSPGTVFLGNSRAQNHRLKCCRAVAPSKTSRQSQTALFRPLLLCCRGSAGSIPEQVGQSQTAIFRPLLLCCRGSAGSDQEQAGQVKQHS